VSILLAGAGVMEFGWAICTWIPAVRYMSRKYEKTIVVCPPGHDYLYQDFADEILHTAKSGRCDRWLCEARVVKPSRPVIVNIGPDKLMVPSEKVCTKGHREYRMYGKDKGTGYPLVVHARAEQDYRSDDRNWPVKRYEKLLRKLGNPEAVSIGTKSQSAHVPGTTDMRNLPMEELCDLLASSKLTIGTSSGPIHLAAMCGCPVAVWTDRSYHKSIKGTNAYRYRKLWNPYRVKATVIDTHGWRPPIGVVEKAIWEML